MRFPGGQTDFQPPSRWLVSRGQVPAGAEALVLFTVEEMAVNDLRETFHHWTRTLALPVQNNTLGKPLPYSGPHFGLLGQQSAADVPAARDLWDDVEDKIKTLLGSYRADLTQILRTQLKSAYEQARDHEKDAFEQRIREVAALQKAQSIDKLKREIEQQRVASIQQQLFDDADALAEKRLRDLEDELKRRQNQFGDLQERLTEEKRRILEQVLPRRFALRGEAQVFPVTIEIRFPEVGV